MEGVAAEALGVVVTVGIVCVYHGDVGPAEGLDHLRQRLGRYHVRRVGPTKVWEVL